MIVKLLAAISTVALLAPTATAGQDSLDTLIRDGLDRNRSLQARNFTYRQSLSRLRAARAAFLPSVDLDARYSRAGGGRRIDVPVGTLLQPVYSSLNELLAAEGRPAAFPETLDDLSIPFLRTSEQETRLRLVQPILQPELRAHVRISSEDVAIAHARRRGFARQLVAHIKEAWWRYQIATRVDSLLARNERRLVAHVRHATALVENGAATPEIRHRARAELLALNQRRVQASADVARARRYVNFLANRPLAAPLQNAEPPADDLQLPDASMLRRQALAAREELIAMDAAEKRARLQGALARAASRPSLALAIDYGLQGERYRIDGDSDYWMASLSLRWSIFDRFAGREARAQAELAARRTAVELENMRQDITLELHERRERVQVMQAAMRTAAARLQSARSSFDIVRTQFAAGSAGQTSYLDARDALAEAENSAALAGYEREIARAWLEYSAATFVLPASFYHDNEPADRR